MESNGSFDSYVDCNVHIFVAAYIKPRDIQIIVKKRVRVLTSRRGQSKVMRLTPKFVEDLPAEDDED